MYTVGIILFVLIVLTPAITLGMLYVQYQNWPPYLWKERVLRHVESLQRRCEGLQREPSARDEVQVLFDEYLARHLHSIPLEVLDEYPGIGPATVARLRSAGYRSLGEIADLHFEAILGIGPTRATALRDAARMLVRQARSRFEAGACPEAVEYRRRAEAVRDAERERRTTRQRELAAVETALHAAKELHAHARDITFWTYLFHRDEPGVSDEVMHTPLPPVVVAPAQVKPAPTVVAVPPLVPVAASVAIARAVPKPVASPPPLPPAPAPVPVPPISPTVAHPVLPRMLAFARFAFVVAKSDSRVAQSERKVIRAFLASKFGHHDVLARHIDPLIEQVEAAIPSESETLSEVRLLTTDGERRELYQFAEQIADAAGDRKPREIEMLARIAHAFGIADTQVTPPPASPPTAPAPPLVPVAPVESPPDPRALLEIPSDADLTPDLIRRRFRQLSDRLDPAKARQMGPEFAHMAEEKLAKLRAAAEHLLVPFREPLEKPAEPPTDLRHNPDLDDVFGG